MKTYLEGCGVPTARVGEAEVPRLIMGIHPYDGCSYQSAGRDADNLRAFGQVHQVVEVLRYAVEEEGVTAAQVDLAARSFDLLRPQRPRRRGGVP